VKKNREAKGSEGPETQAGGQEPNTLTTSWFYEYPVADRNPTRVGQRGKPRPVRPGWLTRRFEK